MSLVNPTWLEKATPRQKAIVFGVVAIVLIGAVLFTADWFTRYRADKSLSKDKQAIVIKANEIANITNQISNLEQQKSEKQGELKRDAEVLANNIYGREDAKAETNRAVANFANAVNANSQNVTATDIERALKKLDDQENQ